ncbi:hypothetical protein [Pedobacter helvus]|uniref:Uncharacterized protein n=1 Tax=Pedobacter helvus TaxID=2563444 RepID=A0ABW9JJC3_9SPHI|nr:hypothetical protein [Pedobacter ureilyticus]
MKKSKLVFGLAALCLAFGLVFSMSAFKATTENPSQKKRAEHFYRYIGPDYSESEIRDYTNYEKSDSPCEDGVNLCGVFLASDPSGTDQPVQSELDAVANNLWTSQQNGSSVDSETILMRE